MSDQEKTAPKERPVARPADLLPAETWQFEYRQKTNPRNSNLELLAYGTYRVAPGAASDELFHRGEETILFTLGGAPVVELDDRRYDLAHYDTLYLPPRTPYRIVNSSQELCLLALCRAAAQNRYQPIHSAWERIRRDETRVRHLDGKDVFLMFDVAEPADKLLAGYTIYRPYARAWPPHNHTDQEEIYIFTKGRGALEVYADEKSKTFVHNVGPMDAATIPTLNYHPVFSQEEEVHFIWCLAGARYWIGDKHKEFMDASVDELTT